jgi:predicted dehydrogenase
LYSKTVEDHAHVVFGFGSGLRGYLDASWSARHYRTPTIHIHYQAENGTLDVDDDRVRVFLDEAKDGFESGWRVWNKPDLPSSATIDIGGAHYTAQMEEFVGAVRGHRRVDSDVQSALKVQHAIDAAYRSAENNGSPVRVGSSLK